ncbi:unnamed protein product [Lampetra fluviatilis]
MAARRGGGGGGPTSRGPEPATPRTDKGASGPVARRVSYAARSSRIMDASRSPDRTPLRACSVDAHHPRAMVQIRLDTFCSRLLLQWPGIARISAARVMAEEHLQRPPRIHSTHNTTSSSCHVDCSISSSTV